MPAALALTHTNLSNGARLVATDGRTLPLTGVTITAEAAGGLCRVTLEQRFENPYEEALRLRYLVPLPEDGAVSAYRFVLGDRVIEGRVQTRAAARQQFEQAIFEGRTAALLEEERGSLFSQELGNVPPKATIVCTLTIDQRLVWLDEGSWEWRFPVTVAPRFLGNRTPDAERVVVPVASGALAAAVKLSMRIGDEGALPSSPSHPLRLEDGAVVSEGALDRDLVVRWGARRPNVGISLVSSLGERGAHGLVTITPPSVSQRALGRDVCLLLDTSGSMDGMPLDQARAVASAIVRSLGAEDQLEMIEFGDRARRWKRGSTPVNDKTAKDALAWLAKLSASGGTDMTAGILEALSTLRADAQRQVVLITDGQIGFEQEVLRQIRSKLPARSRLHTVGVGSAVNRSLTAPAARAGSGIEIVLGLDESAEPAAQRLVRRTAQPIVTDVVLSGSAVLESAPRRSADLYANAPAMLAVALRPEGGALVVTGRTATGTFESRMFVQPIVDAVTTFDRALPTYFARERVADLELDHASGEAVDPQIEAIGLQFGIATRLTSFVAISSEITVDAGAPSRREEMPHTLPHGMSAAGVGLRSSALSLGAPAAEMFEPMLDESMAELSEGGGGFGGFSPPSVRGPGGAMRSRVMASAPMPPPASPPAPVVSKPAMPAAAPKMSAPKGAREERSSGSSFESAKKKEKARRNLSGKIVLRNGRTLVIEIVVDEDRTWDITAIDGAPATLEAGSTRGAVKAGQIARLVLALDDVPSSLELTIGGEIVIVELTA